MDYPLLKLSHLLVMAAWLGLEFGVFILFSWHRSTTISADDRRLLARFHEPLTLGPRLFWMPMLVIGIALAWAGNWAFTGDLGTLIVWTAVAVGLVWLAAQIYVFRVFSGGLSGPQHLARARSFGRVDTVFRVSIITGLLVIGISSLVTGTPITPGWLAWKVTLFSVLIASGVNWKPLSKKIVVARNAVVEGDHSPEHAGYARLTRLGQFILVGQWTIIIALAWLAVAKPTL